MANKINEIINYGIQNKRKKEEIMQALLNADVEISSATSTIKSLDESGLFKYESEGDAPQVNGQQKFQEALKFAKDNVNSDDVELKTRSNKFLLDVESKKVLPNGYKVQSDEVAAILQNPDQWNELTASVKGELMPELAKAGFKFPRKLTGEQEKARQNAEAGITAIQDMKTEIFDESGNIKTANLIQEKLPFALGARKLRQQIQSAVDPISRIRSGAALTEDEVKFYKNLVPSPGDTAEDARYKMEQLEVFFSGMAGSEIMLKNADGKLVKYDDMFNPRQRSEVRKAMQNGYSVHHGNEFDVVYGETIVDGDPIIASREEVAQEELNETSQNRSSTQSVERNKPNESGFMGKLGKFGEGVGDFLGGNKIGDAIGGVIGNQIAKHGKAGENFAQSVAQIQIAFENGEISQEKRDQALESLEKDAKETFGYSGPGAREIAGDVGKIALNFIGGGALKGVTTASKVLNLGKLAGIGAGASATNAMADDEEITAGKLATGGGVLALFGVGGKVAGKGGRYIKGKLDESIDTSGKAEKLATEILQPTKKEVSEALERGSMPKAVSALIENVKKSKDFKELRGHLGATTEALFEKRNKIIKENNFEINNYLDPLKKKIQELKDNSLASPTQIKRMEELLKRESDYIKGLGGKILRVDAQQRKEAIQDITQTLLKKKNAGNLAEDEASDKIALDAIRQGLKKAVEGGDDMIKEINGKYEGLKRAQELLSGREALALKAEDRSLLQKVAAPIIELISAGTGAGSAAFVARKASTQQNKLSTLTKRLEKLSQDKGGVFTEFYKKIKNINIGEQGPIGETLDNIDSWTDGMIEKFKGKGGLNIEEIPNALRVAIEEVEKNMRALLDRGVSEKSSQFKQLYKRREELWKKASK